MNQIDTALYSNLSAFRDRLAFGSIIAMLSTCQTCATQDLIESGKLPRNARTLNSGFEYQRREWNRGGSVPGLPCSAVGGYRNVSIWKEIRK